MKVRRNIAIGLAGWALLAVAGPSRGQNPNPVIGTATQSFPSNVSATVSNAYLRLDMRVPQIAQTINTTGGLVGYSNYRGGRVLVRTTSGDPFTTADDNVSIVAGQWLTQTRIQVGTPGTGTTALPVYELESLYQTINNPQQDVVLASPTAGSDNVTMTWQIRQGTPGVAAIVPANTTTTNGGLTGFNSASILAVTENYQLVRDMVRQQVEIANTSGAEQVVSVEILADPTFGRTTNDGQPIFVSNVRSPLQREFLFPSTNTSDEAGLRVVPKTWRTFDSTTTPGVVLGGVWDNDDIRTSSLTAGVPTNTAFVNAGLAGVTEFGYTPVNFNLANQDWAVLTRWVSIRIPANSTRRFITYYGLGAATSDFSQPYVFSLEAPFSLALATGDDPNTATVEPATNSYRTPNPFTLRAFVQNVSNRPLSNVSISLALPDGFALATPGDTVTKTISTVPVASEQQVSWQIRSLSTQQPGSKTITASASGTGLVGKVLTRDIGIPALPQLDFPSITRRLDMISIPYDFQNRDLGHVLASLGNLGVTGGGNAAVARYNPSVKSYAFFPDSFITSINPGEGFWLFNGALTQLVLPSDRTAILPTTAVGVPLNPDWNQVGCPYTVPTRLFDTSVVTSDNTTRTFSDAVNQGLVRPVLYEYVPNATDATKAGTYTFSGDDTTTFNPWRGYWIRVLQPVTLLYQATSLIGPFRRQGPDYVRLRSGWEISLQASGSGDPSQPVRLGQDTLSRDTYDSRDIESPPDLRSGAAVRMAVTHTEWGNDNGYYLRDIRSASGRPQQYQLQCDSDAPNQDVTLRWNLRGAPADVQFTLVDLESGARRYMRTTSGYVYNTGPFGRSRHFLVTAERRGANSLAIPSMAATPTRGRGVHLGFTLTAPATVQVVIESPTGRRVRTVAAAFDGQEGQNEVAWDGRDDQGRPVPSGQYRCRVLVHTADGQQAIAERIVVLNR